VKLTDLKKTVEKYSNLISPDIIFGICLTESPHTEQDIDINAIRYEPRFRETYVVPLGLPLSSEILLSFSYGLMQMMGESLLEVGYFYDFFNHNKDLLNLDKPSGEVTIAKGINHYIGNADIQIQWGIKWFLRKLHKAENDIDRALLLYNGGGNPNYPLVVKSNMKLYGRY